MRRTVHSAAAYGCAVLATAALSLPTADAQLVKRAEAPTREYQLGDIDFMELSDFGTLLVGHGQGLAAIDPTRDAVVFNFEDFGRVNADEVQAIPLSPYVVVDKALGGESNKALKQVGLGGLGKGLASTANAFAGGRKAILDAVSGEILYDTKADGGWKDVQGFQVLLPQNLLLIHGTRGKGQDFRYAVGVHDLGAKQALGEVELKLNEFMTGKPFYHEGRVYIPTAKTLICAEARTGNELWRTKTDDLSWIQADATGQELYGFEVRGYGKSTRIHKFSPDGKTLWAKPYEIKGTVNRFEIRPEGIAVVSDVVPQSQSVLAARAESKIAFVDAKSGQDLWSKAPKTKGYVQHFYVMDDGILFGLQDGGINKIGFDGSPLFRKPLKTGPNIHTMARTPKGLIYITDEDADIVDLRTGETVFSKPIKYKKAEAVSSTYDPVGKRYLISTGEEVIAIDEATGAQSTLAKSKRRKWPPGSRCAAARCF